MLHIHNGDSSAGTLRESGFPGTHFAWREVLMCGPTPAGLTTDEWLDVRSAFLASESDEGQTRCREDLARQDQLLSTFPDQDEVVLWFEYDLFCQINLIYVLARLSQLEILEKPNTKLSLICIAEFPGIADFRGLGQLTGEQMASLFDGRVEVTPRHLSLAQAAWRAYCSPNPTSIEALLETDMDSLPLLKPALAAHLTRFPSVRNGLGIIENTALDLIHGGAGRFGPLFMEFGATLPILGLGDLQFWSALRQLTAGPQPLLRMSASDSTAAPESGMNLHRLTFEITPYGESVRLGKEDALNSNPPDSWLGGVHLQSGSPIWRWDEDGGTLRLN